MSTPIRCRCRGCSALIKAPAQLRGQTRACPRCSTPLVVQPEPPEDSEPVLVMEFVPYQPASNRRGW